MNTPISTFFFSPHIFKTASNNIENPRGLPKDHWKRHYCYYIEMIDPRFIQAENRFGVSLYELYSQLKGDVFPGTVKYGKQLSVEKFRSSYARKSHVRITQKASRFIDLRLSKLLKDYGAVS